MNKILFLDRDGVINILDTKGYTCSCEDFHFVPGIFQLCKQAQYKGYKIVVITNQTSIGRGYYTEAQMQQVHNFMRQEFQKRNIIISDIFYTTKVESECRKPNPGMFEYAKQKYGLSDEDMLASVAIGDKPTDAQAALGAGVGHIYFLKRNQRVENGKVVSYPTNENDFPPKQKTDSQIKVIRCLNTLKKQL